MTDLAGVEYHVLRQTISARGGLRPIAFLVGLVAWAATLVLQLTWLANPLASVVPLVVLLGSFEVVRTLHLGVERIGRYIQVFFEESDGGSAATAAPAWERTAMTFGPTLPGAGGHPYYLPVFLVATPVNFVAVLVPGPLPVELITLAVPHVAFMAWMLYCDRGMRKQRIGDLERFRALRASGEFRSPDASSKVHVHRPKLS